MASLREIKDHISSVRSTLKITSAMKLVASAKLRKAQQAVEGMRPYTEALSKMLERVVCPVATGEGQESPVATNTVTAIVAVASNSSLCGAFNINVIHKVEETVSQLKAAGQTVEVISVGRKMAEAMRKAGFPSDDYSDLVGHNSFDKSASFAQTLIDAFNSGKYGRVLLIYNHFVSTASQKVALEQYLPFGLGRRTDRNLRTPYPPSDVEGGAHQRWEGPSGRLEEVPVSPPATENDFILEPSREEILKTLLPQVMRLRVHTVLLDSIAAEHAARTLAMQTASDNAEDLLGELSLEYNKGRQQKITAEILDLVGGAQQ